MTGYNIRTNISIPIHIELCYDCGTPIGIEQGAWLNLQDDGGTFYCWRGHRCTTGEGTKQAEIRRLREDKERLEQWNREERARAERAERRERAQKAAKTRIKNRVAKGVCPCCKRSFVNLARHMASKHPNYTHQDD